MFQQIKAVFFKEIKIILRDKRSFFTSLIVPMLLIPLMFLVMDFAMTKNSGSNTTTARIAIDKKNNSFYNFCKAQDENLTIVEVKDKTKAFDTGEIQAYAEVDENIDNEILNGDPINLKIDYNEKSMSAMLAIPVIMYYENTYRYYAEQDYSNFNSIDEIRNAFDVKLPPYTAEDQGVTMDNIDFIGISMNMLIPMLLLLYCYYGSIGTASDLTVGEKERGTLEPLLSTSARKTSIILGKLFATTTMGIISSLCTIAGFGISLISSSDQFRMSISEMNVLFAIILFSSLFFSAINMTLGISSRSSKEAQTYFTPITFLLTIPSYFTYLMNISQIKIAHLSIPVFNIVCIIKEVFSHAVNPIHFLIVLAWLIIYTTISCLITCKVFKKESVIFRT